MQFVYVLVSSENDYFYEYFLISVISLRLNNQNADIVLLLDKDTDKSLANTRCEYSKYITRKTVVNTPVGMDKKCISRFIKTSIPVYVSGDFLYIDSDTVICSALNVESVNMSIGAVLDTHVKIERHHLKKHFFHEDEVSGFSSAKDLNVRYNGGVVYCDGSENGIRFFEKWHSLWNDSKERGITQDMPSFNQANLLLGNIIADLPDEWNCQITYNGLKFLANSRIIHYFATSLSSNDSPYALATTEILKAIMATGETSKEIMQLINNPRTAFITQIQLLYGEKMLDVRNSELFSFIFWLYRKHFGIFNFLNSLLFKLKRH
jgi:hypothetical protein